MWSVGLVFCDCGFHSVGPLMDKDKRLMELPDGRDWLRGKLCFVLVGGSMLSKFNPIFCSWVGLCSLPVVWPEKRSVFIPIPKKVNAKECSNYHTIALISDASKVRLKILQASLQEYVNHEFPDVQAGFGNGKGTRDEIANICWIMEKVREFQKNIYFCFIWLCGSQLTVENSESDENTRTPDLPLEKPVCRSEATVRTGYGTTDWFQIGKGVRQGCILSPCLFNFYAEYILRNAGVEEAQAGIKIARRNLNNLRYADDTTIMAEREE